MKFLINLAKPLIKKLVLREIENPKTKEYIINIINNKINIPKMDEKEEAKLLSQIYTAATEAAVTIIDRI